MPKLKPWKLVHRVTLLLTSCKDASLLKTVKEYLGGKVGGTNKKTKLTESSIDKNRAYTVHTGNEINQMKPISAN